MDSPLIHHIYTSAATLYFESHTLLSLLEKARAKNASLGVTGMLLFENGSFFQILEGPEAAVDALYKTIAQDNRHEKCVTIIREPIAKRAFAEWTMGLGGTNAQELDEIVGLNDFFTSGKSFEGTSLGRAKKLLDAFRQGRWRSKVNYTKPVETNLIAKEVFEELPVPVIPHSPFQISMNLKKGLPEFSFAFQPIANIRTGEIKSYEALVRGKNGGSAAEVFDKISEEDKYRFDEILRISAIALAGKLGIKCDLNLNFLPRSLSSSPTAISSTVDAAKKAGIPSSSINIEITEKEIIENVEWFRDSIVKYRHEGVKFSLDDFGAGYSGLNLLADFQPESIKIDITLVRDIDTNGPRQAIVRGILRTCQDLGIDVIAEGVESNAECKWFFDEGIELIQGYFLAKPGFEALPIPQMPKYFSN